MCLLDQAFILTNFFNITLTTQTLEVSSSLACKDISSLSDTEILLFFNLFAFLKALNLVALQRFNNKRYFYLLDYKVQKPLTKDRLLIRQVLLNIVFFDNLTSTDSSIKLFDIVIIDLLDLSLYNKNITLAVILPNFDKDFHLLDYKIQELLVKDSLLIKQQLLVYVAFGSLMTIDLVTNILKCIKTASLKMTTYTENKATNALIVLH
jgi:hypothetical protein